MMVSSELSKYETPAPLIFLLFLLQVLEWIISWKRGSGRERERRRECNEHTNNTSED